MRRFEGKDSDIRMLLLYLLNLLPSQVASFSAGPPGGGRDSCWRTGDANTPAVSHPWTASPFRWLQPSPRGVGGCFPWLRWVAVPEAITVARGFFLRWIKPESCPVPYGRGRGQPQIHLLERVPHKRLCSWKKLEGRECGRIKTIITTAHPTNLLEQSGRQLQVSKSLTFFTSSHQTH